MGGIRNRMDQELLRNLRHPYRLRILYPGAVVAAPQCRARSGVESRHDYLGNGDWVAPRPRVGTLASDENVPSVASEPAKVRTAAQVIAVPNATFRYQHRLQLIAAGIVVS